MIGLNKPIKLIINFTGLQSAASCYYFQFIDLASARRSCRNNPDVFCYICGEYTLSVDRKNITRFVKHAYQAYFEVKLGDQDKSWAPHTVRKTCVEYLRRWTKGAKTSLKFGIPMVWREPFDHA